MTDGEADDVGLDLLQRAKVTVLPIEGDAGSPDMAASADTLPMSGETSLRRPEKDWIAMCGKSSAVSEWPSVCSAARNSTPAS